MRRFFAVVLSMVLAGTLAACDSQTMMVRLFSADQEKAARAYIEDIRRGDFPPVEKDLDPAFKNASMAATLTTYGAFLFAGDTPRSVKTVGATTVKAAGGTTTNLTFEYEFPQGWRLAQIALKKTGSGNLIVGLHSYSMSSSLEQANAFTFRGRKPLHFAFLAAVIAVFLFTLATAIICWRTPIPRFKWLWRLSVVLGLGQVSLNWSSGAFGVHPLGLQLFAAAFSRALYGPVILQFGLPLGAISFWLWRGKWKAPSQQA